MVRPSTVERCACCGIDWPAARAAGDSLTVGLAGVCHPALSRGCVAWWRRSRGSEPRRGSPGSSVHLPCTAGKTTWPVERRREHGAARWADCRHRRFKDKGGSGLCPQGARVADAVPLTNISSLSRPHNHRKRISARVDGTVSPATLREAPQLWRGTQDAHQSPGQRHCRAAAPSKSSS